MTSKNIIELCILLLTSSMSSANQPSFEACNMLIVIDERLYNHYNRSIDDITVMVKDFVKIQDS